MLEQYELYVVTRSNTPLGHRENLITLQHNLGSEDWKHPINQFHFCIFCAESTLVKFIPDSLKINDLILISSASRVLKNESKDKHDKALTAQLAAAEMFVTKNYQSFSIIRPTWIFDGKNDKISRVYINLTRKLRVFPFTWMPNGQRNPIDTKTIAHVIFLLMQKENLGTKSIFNIGGCRRYEYRKLVNKILKKNDINPLPLYLPLSAYLLALKLLHILGVMKNIHGYMFKHMELDLDVDNSQLPKILQNLIASKNAEFWNDYDKK